MLDKPYTDPESYVRGGQTLATFFLYLSILVDQGRDDPNVTKIEPSSACLRNAI